MGRRVCGAGVAVMVGNWNYALVLDLLGLTFKLTVVVDTPPPPQIPLAADKGLE